MQLRFLGRLGFGRPAALAAARRMFPTQTLSPARQALSLLVGAIMIGTGISLMTRASLGLAPFDVLISALLPRVGLSFGQTVWLVNGVLFLVAAALGQRPSGWGITYILSIGFAVDMVSGLVNSPDTLAGRAGFVVVALVLLCGGISLVVHSGTTGGPFELLTAAGEARGLDGRFVRAALEGSVLILGIVLGGNFGPATLVIAMGIGPVLGVMSQAFADHAHGRAGRLPQDMTQTQHPGVLTQSAR